MAPAPKVSVKIPDVKLRLEDLVYLRSLQREDGIRCAISRHHLDRLLVLGLVKLGITHPSIVVREDVAKRIADMSETAYNLLKAKKWDELRNVCYQAIAENRRLAPMKKEVLSAAGRDLLEKGSVMVMMAKGCAK